MTKTNRTTSAANFVCVAGSPSKHPVNEGTDYTIFTPKKYEQAVKEEESQEKYDIRTRADPNTLIDIEQQSKKNPRRMF